MTNQDNLYDIIEQYLNGAMTPEEKLTFEREYDTNPDVKKEVDDYILMKKVVRYHGSLQRKKEIETLYKEHRIKRTRTWQILFAAAAVFIIGFFYLANQPQTPLKLLDQYASITVEEYSPGTMMGDDSTTSPKERFAQVYKLKDEDAYQDSLEASIVRLEANERITSNTENAFFLGLFHFEAGNISEALAYFKKAESSSDVMAAEWMQGLCYLAQEDVPNAKRIFKKIVENPDHDYPDRAKDILKNLNRLE